MAQIKETIQILCRFLTLTTECVVTAEHFRLAKFDKKDAGVVQILWALLDKLLQCDFNQFCCLASYFGDSRKAGSKLQQAVAAFDHVTVKCKMFELGYVVPYFHNLTIDGEGRGSRELLLAIAWLLAVHKTLDKLMSRSHICFDELILNEKLKQVKDGDVGTSESRGFDPPNCSTDADRQKFMSWLAGRIRNSYRCILSAEEHKANLLSRCRQAKDAAQKPDTDFYMIQHNELFDKNVVLLKKEKMITQTYIQWKKTEHIFWKWMDSVFQERIKSPSPPLATEPVAPPIQSKQNPQSSASANSDKCLCLLVKYEQFTTAEAGTLKACSTKMLKLPAKFSKTFGPAIATIQQEVDRRLQDVVVLQQEYSYNIQKHYVGKKKIFVPQINKYW